MAFKGGLKVLYVIILFNGVWLFLKFQKPSAMDYEHNCESKDKEIIREQQSTLQFLRDFSY